MTSATTARLRPHGRAPGSAASETSRGDRDGAPGKKRVKAEALLEIVGADEPGQEWLSHDPPGEASKRMMLGSAIDVAGKEFGQHPCRRGDQRTEVGKAPVVAFGPI